MITKIDNLIIVWTSVQPDIFFFFSAKSNGDHNYTCLTKAVLTKRYKHTYNMGRRNQSQTLNLYNIYLFNKKKKISIIPTFKNV